MRVCYCEHIRLLETRTRVVLLQHPRERDVPIGTAHMANLCLPNSELHVGIDWGGSPALQRALTDPARPAALLYPGDTAADVLREPPRGAITLVVVDGTWWQTRKVVRLNPILAELPRYAFTPALPSEYRIRKEPTDACVSTIEALATVLGALEGDPERFHALLDPFRAMVAAQVDFATNVRNRRGGKRRAQRQAKLRLPDVLVNYPDKLVCVVAEAKAWPYRFVDRRKAEPDELVHWVAHRPSTGETFESVVKPQGMLTPNLERQIGLSPEHLEVGETVRQLRERWRGFVREDDVIASWGFYAPALFAAQVGPLPTGRLDIRQGAIDWLGGKVGTVEELAARLGALAPALTQGRGGARLAALVAIAQAMASAARAERRRP
jgi:DTW domain-containing protein YfiP